jgi:predicted DNA-binding protein (MmcQ/YjbR family)
MNKQHWNTVMVDGSIPEKEVKAMIDHSYDEVVKGMTKKQRQELENL